jgi:hypothetical protein
MSIKPLLKSLATLTLALLVAPITASIATAIETSPKLGTSETATSNSIPYTWAGKIYLNGKLSTKESIDSLSITGGNFGTFSKVDGSYIVKLPAEAKILTFCYTSRGDAPYNTNSSHCTHLDTSLRTNKNSEIPNNYDLYFNTNSGKIITGIIVSPAKKVNGLFPTTYIKVYNELGVHESMNVFGNRYQIYIPSEATRITFCQKDMDCIEQELKYLANFNPSTGKVTYDPSFRKATPVKPSNPITVTTPKPNTQITNTNPKPNTTTVTEPKPGTQAQKAATDLSKSLNKVWKPNLSPSDLIKSAVALTTYVSGVTINSVPFFQDVTFYDVIASDGFRCVIAKLDDKKLVYSVENSDCENYINIVGPDNLKSQLTLKLFIYSPLNTVGIIKYTPAFLQKFGATINDKNLVVLNTKKGISVTIVGKADVAVLIESDSKGKLVATNTKPGIKAQKAAMDLANSLNKVWKQDISSSELISKAVKLTPYVSGVTINSFPYFMDIIMYDVIAVDGFRCVAARFVDDKIVYSAVNSDCKNYVNTVGAEGLRNMLYLKFFMSNLLLSLTEGKYTPELIQKFGAGIKDKNLLVTNTPKGISVSLIGKADVVVLLESDSKGKIISN